MAIKPQYKWKKVTRNTVIQTWQTTLKDENLLPEDWTRVKGVIVGTGVLEDETADKRNYA